MALKIQTTEVPTVTRTGAGRKPKPLTNDECSIISALKSLEEGKALTFGNPVAVEGDTKATKRATDALLRHVRNAFDDEDLTIRSVIAGDTITLWVRPGKINRPRKSED